MNQRPSASHPVRWVILASVATALAVAGYEVLQPSPMAFAGGKTVTLAAWHGEDPTGVPAELRSASLAERGEYLARAADCEACHTVEGGAPYAGGRAFVLPFGTLYSTNITPDPDTGIGRYSDRNWLDALHKGIGRGGDRLYPAMPYASYTYMSDADALAIKAYLFSLQPVKAPPPQNTLAFPFNQRGLMALWAAFFNPDKRFELNTQRSAQWNRGAYLAEGMGHCGECHTPRNLFFALNNRSKYAGAVQAGWRAYNITTDRTSGVGDWSDADLVHYLSLGHADGHGTASGPMGEAVDQSLKFLKPDDIVALVAYLRSVNGVASNDLPQPRMALASRTPVSADGQHANPHGRAAYEGACAGCHGWTGQSPIIPSASLTGARAVNDPTAINVAQVVIHGGPRHLMSDPSDMPAFGTTYSDEEIASVANYVTARFGAKPSSLTAAGVAKLRREQ
ncbi:MAG TPA: cytochrome c [Steroidobacteraceae bacterium]|jgi:mono/diheme cytochrome c family protein